MKGPARALPPQDAFPPGSVEVLISTLGDMRDQIKQLAATMNGIRLRGCRYVPVPAGFANGQTTMRISTRSCELLGWSLWESTGNQSIVVAFRDAAGDTGDLVAPIQLAGGGSSFQRFAPGISFSRGLTLAVQAGTGIPIGSIFLAQS